MRNGKSRRLGQRALDVLRSIARLETERGRTPDLAQVARDMGLAAASTVWTHVRVLRALGYLEHDQSALVLTERGRIRAGHKRCRTCGHMWEAVSE